MPWNPHSLAGKGYDLTTAQGSFGSGKTKTLISGAADEYPGSLKIFCQLSGRSMGGKNEPWMG
jgi:hypothetical protein